MTSACGRRVLLIAFHFPPVKGSSGVQRTLRFAQYLPRYGWRPIVLTIVPSAYGAVSRSIGNEVPQDIEVHRAFGVDTANRLSFFGRYPRALALPDRWATWRFWGVRSALRILRKTPVDAVWSTFPIATAHRIALQVARRTALPWIAEFRDPMWQGDYPPDPAVNRSWQELERQIFSQACSVIVSTPGAAALYRERFPRFGDSRIGVIENGYDEEAFSRAAASLDRSTEGSRAGPLVLVHSGLIYPSERDPRQFFAALAALKGSGRISAADVSVILRAAGNEVDYARRIAALNIADIVRLEPPIEYLAALQEMLSADGLLILQGSNCSAQVPAKLYEYLRSGRPILALTDPESDTARTLREVGTGRVARLDSEKDIEAALVSFIQEIRDGAWRRPDSSVIARYSREAQAGHLARTLEDAVGRSKSAGVCQGL
jgi:glycosyltransferase involved in cell wall biosynthesis